MSYKTEEIKKSIKLHSIKTEKFKTNIIAVFLSVPLDKNMITENALIPAVLRRGTNRMTTQEEISINLENMYGATFDCGIEKTGDNQILKFYLEMVNDEFLPKTDKNLQNGLNLLLDIVFNPFTKNNSFDEDYVNTEKENLRKIIEAKKDNKDRFAYERCIEEMYKNKTYGLYKFGYVEDLDKIDAKKLYEQYLYLINNAKIDIFVSGNVNEEKTKKIVNLNPQIQLLNGRTDIHVISNNNKFEKKDVNIVEDKLDVTQGKLVIGTDVDLSKEDAKYKIAIYNAILGESATSKLFQNVREKESLAYTARSNYVRQKGNIYIRCGIEIENYEKTVKVIKEQLEDMKNGKFTDEDIENAKLYMLAGLKNIREEQDSELTYYFGQEISGEFTSFEEYEEKIKKVTREDVAEVANSIRINTIYFLKN